MILSNKFWKVEHEAPLLNRNSDFATKDNAIDLTRRAKKWVNIVEDKHGTVPLDDDGSEVTNEALLRIFAMDAERTFKTQENRSRMAQMLERVCSEIGDYHQGLGFVTAYLLLHVEDTDDVAKIILGLHRHYINGYYKAAPRAYVRDAKVFYMALEKYFPHVHVHIKDMIVPEAFCSKWFIGFCVHVLPFPALMDFMEAVLQHGQPFLWRFGLSLVQNCESDLLATKDVGRILEILRLDTTVYPDDKTHEDSPICGSFFQKIVEDALCFSIDDLDVENLRKKAEAELQEADERRAQKEAERADESDDEIVFSDEEED